MEQPELESKQHVNELAKEIRDAGITGFTADYMSQLLCLYPVSEVEKLIDELKADGDIVVTNSDKTTNKLIYMNKEG